MIKSCCENLRLQILKVTIHENEVKVRWQKADWEEAIKILLRTHYDGSNYKSCWGNRLNDTCFRLYFHYGQGLFCSNVFPTIIFKSNSVKTRQFCQLNYVLPMQQDRFFSQNLVKNLFLYNQLNIIKRFVVGRSVSWKSEVFVQEIVWQYH